MDAVIFVLGSTHPELRKHMFDKEYFPDSNLQMPDQMIRSLTYAMLTVILALAIFLGGCAQTNNASSKNAVASRDAIRIKVGRAPGSVEIADLNNDKFPDLIIASEQDSNVTILLGNGKGKFTASQNSPFPAGNIPNDIAIGDFNKDGQLDLVFANHERKYLTVLHGDGHGSFVAAPKSPFAVEVRPHTHGVATGDFNNDGRLDLVTDSWGNDEVAVLFGDSINEFKSSASFFKVGKHLYQRIRVADVNRDSKADIVTTNLEGDNVTILLSDGNGGFNEAAGSPFRSGDSPFGVAIGDVNSDGKPDLAVINSPASTADRSGTNGLTVLLGDGTGKFSTMPGSPFQAGKIPNRVAIGDVNGDGVGDVAASDNDSKNISLFLMSREGKVSSSTLITVGNHPKGISIADLNGDGKGEIVVSNNLDNDISIITGE